jgi:hypothetical protein
MLLYLFLLAAAAGGIAVYVLVIARQVPGLTEERFGRRVLPPDIGRWKLDDESNQGRAALARGLERQERLWLHESGGIFGSTQLVRQVRYRETATRQIVRVEPDQVVKLVRKRV